MGALSMQGQRVSGLFDTRNCSSMQHGTGGHSQPFIVLRNRIVFWLKCCTIL